MFDKRFSVLLATTINPRSRPRYTASTVATVARASRLARLLIGARTYTGPWE
jgi:hypothetical protein